MDKEELKRRQSSGNPYAYSILQNLKDAGCSNEMVSQFLSLQDCQDERQQIQLLSTHRDHLLANIHREEKQLDCLDYLLYQMRKKHLSQ